MRAEPHAGSDPPVPILAPDERAAPPASTSRAIQQLDSTGEAADFQAFVNRRRAFIAETRGMSRREVAECMFDHLLAGQLDEFRWGRALLVSVRGFGAASGELESSMRTRRWRAVICLASQLTESEMIAATTAGERADPTGVTS